MTPRLKRKLEKRLKNITIECTNLAKSINLSIGLFTYNFEHIVLYRSIETNQAIYSGTPYEVKNYLLKLIRLKAFF